MDYQLSAQVPTVRVRGEVEVRVGRRGTVADDQQVTGAGLRILAIGILDVQQRVLREWRDAVRQVSCLGQADDRRGLGGGQGPLGNRGKGRGVGGPVTAPP